MTPLDRLIDFVQRDLHAAEVRVAPFGAAFVAMPDLLVAPLDDGRQLVVRFAQPLEDAAHVARRLETIVGSFGRALGARDGESAHALLHAELRSLAARAGARDALVVDAHSPVVWGAADLPDVGDSDALSEASRAALEDLRALPAMDRLARGKHLRHVKSEATGGYLAHAFASIYLVMLVYGDRFDELAAERAVLEALPHIEPLVTALPPLDPAPTPTEDVVSFRRSGA